MNSVSYQTEDRQWDVRINVQSDDVLKSLVENIMLEHTNGKFKYILIGGVEVGTRPNHSDYQVRHVHIAAIFHNRASKSSIVKNWGIIEGNGYYMVPRNRDLPYSGWREHHVKEFSKLDPERRLIFEAGELPKDIKTKDIVKRSDEEKKRKVDEILIDMRQLISEGKEEEAFTKFPRNYLIYGAKLKAMVHQQLNFFKTSGNPHIWLYGYPGTGKTSIMKLIYPQMYKKDLQNKFFDLYDEKIHTHIMLEDVDHENVERLGIQFLKTICDEAGFPIDQKYKTPQITRSTILVTSNFAINDVMPDDQKAVRETIAALLRRFWHVRIDNFLPVLGVKLIDKWERKRLQQNGNNDPRQIYISWDYVQDCPTGLPLKTAEEYQEIVRNKYYNQS